MNLTLKNKAAEHQALLNKVSKIHFITGSSISKQLKDTIQEEYSRCYKHRKKGSDHTSYSRNLSDKNTQQNPESFNLDISHKVSKIKFIKHDKNLLHQYHKEKDQVPKIFKKQHRQQQFCHKLSLQTAVSVNLSNNHSAQKRRSYSMNNSDHDLIVRQQISHLKQRNSTYTIKWRNSASHINKSMRVILGQWLMQFALQVQIPKNAVFNAMHYLDKYVGMVHVPRKQYQQVGLCAIFIASKLQISSHPNIDMYIEAMDGGCSRKQIIQLEKAMVLKLKFRLNPPTLYQYMILVFSLFSNFIKKNYNPQFQDLDISPKSDFYQDIFWILDGIHLQDSYKPFHNKEKVCLTILYICLKKQKTKNNIQNRKKFLNQIDKMQFNGKIQAFYQQFLYQIIRIFSKLADLRECIKVLKKWAKYDRIKGTEQEQIQQLKKIIINQK